MAGTPYRLVLLVGLGAGPRRPHDRGRGHRVRAAQRPGRRRARGRDRGPTDHPALCRSQRVLTRHRHRRDHAAPRRQGGVGRSRRLRRARRRGRARAAHPALLLQDGLLLVHERLRGLLRPAPGDRCGRPAVPRTRVQRSRGVQRHGAGAICALRALGQGDAGGGLGGSHAGRARRMGPRRASHLRRAAGEVRLGDGSVRRGGEIDLGRLRTVAGPGAPGWNGAEIGTGVLGVLPDGSVLHGAHQRRSAGSPPNGADDPVRRQRRRSSRPACVTVARHSSAASTSSRRSRCGPNGSGRARDGQQRAIRESGDRICEVTPDGRLVLLGGAPDRPLPERRQQLPRRRRSGEGRADPASGRADGRAGRFRSTSSRTRGRPTATAS